MGRSGVGSDDVQICPLNHSGNGSFLRFLVDHSPQHKLDFTPKHRSRIGSRFLQNPPFSAVADSFWRFLTNDQSSIQAQLKAPVDLDALVLDHCFLELPVKWRQTSLSTLVFSLSIMRVIPIQK